MGSSAKKRPSGSALTRPFTLGVVAVLAGVAAVTLYRERGGVREWELARRPVEALRRESDAHPDDAILQRTLARRLLAAGEGRDALAPATMAVRADPNDAAGWTVYGEAWLQNGDDQKAIDALDHAISLNPQAASAYLLLARIYSQQQSSQGAIAQLHEYLKLRPRDGSAWEAMADEFITLNEPGNALNAAKQALKIDTGDPRALCLAGEAYRREGALDDAERCFTQALAHRSGDDGALTGLAQVMLARPHGPQEVAHAIALLQQAINTAPGNPSARYELGQALLEAGKPLDALGQWQEMVRRTPDDIRAYHALSLALERLGRSSDAARYRQIQHERVQYRQEWDALVRRLRVNPESAEAQFELARIHMRHNRPDRAASALRAGLAVQPENRWARGMLNRLAGSPQ